MKINFERLLKEAIPPKKSHASDAGWDLFACLPTNFAPAPTGHITVLPHSWAMIPVGWRLHMPTNEELFANNVATFSAVACGYIVVPCIIDPGYSGDIGPVIHNLTEMPIQIEHGQKVSQLLFLQTCPVVVDPSFVTTPIRESKTP
jgi:dUTPase